MATPDDDAQPTYTDALAPAISHTGVVRRGNFIEMRTARQFGSGSLVEIFPECPRCGKVFPEPFINPFFSRVLGVTVYGQFLTCAACLEAVDADALSMKAEHRLKQLEADGFSQVQRAWTFDTYPNQGSPWLRRARQFVNNPVHDILIYGNPGVGKTGLAVAILRGLWAQRQRVRLVRASEMIMSLRGADAAHTQALMHTLATVDYLLIDDLSAIKRTEFWEEVLNVLIDVRQQSNKITILTANIRITSKDDPSSVLAEFFGYVGYDRLVERGEFWNIQGTSQRPAYSRKPAGDIASNSRYAGNYDRE